MITASPGSVRLSLEKARQRFERWRTTRAHRRSPIPPPVWATAVALARWHGLYATACTLHLDDTTLKKRLAAGPGGGPPSASPTFVELPAASPLAECVIELEGPCGGTMRIHVTGTALPDLVALSRVGPAFPALSFPGCFTSRVMRPIRL